jgi:glucokinase
MARYLGIDLGATNIKSVVLEIAEEPSVIDIDGTPTRGEEGHGAVLERLVALSLAKHDALGPVAGIGIGTPGLVDRDTGVVDIFTNLPGQWRGVPIRDRLEAALPVPVTLINDARAFTLAEGRMGAGKGASVVVCMTLGTGIGGGIMIDGHLHMGATGIAGEIAHQTVLPDGPVCGCGNPGCAEGLARSDVLAARAGRNTVEDVFVGVAEGDGRCIEAVEHAANYLGIALGNAVTLLGPDRIVIGGGIVAAGDAFLDPIREATRRRVTLVPHQDIHIVAAELGSEAGAIGAALAAYDSASVTDQPPSTAIT